jgi:hypothetical protein
VTALGETSIVYALAIGVQFLKECLDPAELAPTMIVTSRTAAVRLRED